MGFILRTLIAALGLWLATEWVDGISVTSPTTLILAALLLCIVNAIIKPIAVLLTLLVVNAAMLGLVAAFLPGMGIGSFGAAFWAAIIVSVVSWIGSAMFQSGKVTRAD